MYNCKFIAENGTTFLLGTANNIIFDMNGGNGLSVATSLSQGFDQIGQTVEARSVEGGTLSIRGKIFRDIPSGKAALRKAFAPFQRGRLIFENRFFVDVEVKDSPAFSPVRGNGTFTMQLFTPYPFWRSVNEKNILIGGIEPAFSFPINYNTPHIFGLRIPQKYINVYNDGDIPAQYSAMFTALANISGIKLENIQTREFIKLNGTLQLGQRIKVFRDNQNQLTVDKIAVDGKVENINGWVDDDSNLYTLREGDNLLTATDDSGGTNLETQVTFSPAFGGVYEI